MAREIDEGFGILGPIERELEDTRFWVRPRHTHLEMVRQRVYQIAVVYQDCNDTDFLRIDPALRLSIGKGDEAGAGQSRLSRLENEVLGTEAGPTALKNTLTRSNDALMRRKKKIISDELAGLLRETWAVALLGSRRALWIGLNGHDG